MDDRWPLTGIQDFDSKDQFIEEVLQPFGARFSEPFRPVNVRRVYADGDTVVVLWDGEGTRLDGKPYENTYAWFMRFREGLVVEATAFFDSIAFDELWSEFAPADLPDGPTKHRTLSLPLLGRPVSEKTLSRQFVNRGKLLPIIKGLGSV